MNLGCESVAIFLNDCCVWVLCFFGFWYSGFGGIFLIALILVELLIKLVVCSGECSFFGVC